VACYMRRKIDSTAESSQARSQRKNAPLRNPVLLQEEKKATCETGQPHFVYKAIYKQHI